MLGRFSLPAFDRRDFVLALLLTAGFTLLAFGLLFLLPRPAIKYDAVEYQLLAESLARGEGFRFHPGDQLTAYRPPLYPALLALAFTVFGNHIDVAYGLQAALHGLTVGLTYVLGRHLLDRFFAVIAAILTGVSVGLTCLVGFVMTETLQTLLVVLGMLVLLRWAQEWSPRWAAATGLIWGLAILAKGTNLAVLAVAIATAPLLWSSGLQQTQARRWLSGVGIIAAVMALTILPWTVRNLLLFERPVAVSTNIGIQLYVATLDPITFDRGDPRMMAVVNEAASLGLNEAATDALFLRRGLERFVAEPFLHLLRAPRNAIRSWELPPRDALEYLKPTVMYNDLLEYRSLVWLHYLTLTLAAAGLVRGAWNRDSVLILLWTVPVAVSLVYSPFWVIYRFTAPALPMLYLSAAYALVGLPTPSIASRALVRFRGLSGAHAAVSRQEEEAADADGDRPRRSRPSLAQLAAAALVVAAGAVAWGTHRPGFAFDSPHPYPNDADLAWVVVNPDDGAKTSAAHLAGLELAGGGDRLYLLDQDWQIHHELKAGDLAEGGWTPAVPGRFVVFKLVTNGGGQAWGFRVDGVMTIERAP